MHKIIVPWVNAHESYSASHRVLRPAIINSVTGCVSVGRNVEKLGQLYIAVRWYSHFEKNVAVLQNN